MTVTLTVYKDRMVQRFGPTLKHGLSHTPEYRVWQTMRHRCLRDTSPAWDDYGGRGITIYEGWVNDPAAFIAHVGPRPSPAHEIDRIDNNGNYEPGNVHWVTRPKNDRNRRSNRLVTFRGETKTLSHWCATFAIPLDTLKYRLNNDWGVERALTTPVRPKSPAGTKAARKAFIKAHPRKRDHEGRYIPNTEHFVAPPPRQRSLPTKE